jgi:hypothetical protein
LEGERDLLMGLIFFALQQMDNWPEGVSMHLIIFDVEEKYFEILPFPDALLLLNNKGVLDKI